MIDSLDHVIYFFGSGCAFFIGVAAILAGLCLSLVTPGKWLSLARNLAVLLGGVLVTISAAPLEWWLYGVVAAFTCVWLPLEWRKAAPRGLLAAARSAVLAAWLLALGLELPYHVAPALPALGKPALLLIGDSVSAGMSDADKTTWPRLFAQQHNVEVIDCSKMGATVKSARKQAEKLGDMAGLVLLEIGGNDLLGSTNADQFEEQLDWLLAEVCRPNRTVVMLALPLPPLANRFGLAQRRLARKYDVVLIPQRIFAGAITGPGATVDGIHLTAAGHQRMADTIWTLLQSAYE